MAKNSQKVQGSSRIRLVVLEAEGDGDLSQIAHAIQNALRPRDQTPQPARVVNDSENVDLPETEEFDEPQVQEPSNSAVVKTTKPRSLPNPKVLADVDLISEPTFANFASEKNPPSDRMKYLVVAAWFKEHRGVHAISMNHVYSCYRAMKWTIPKGDFAQPPRNLKFDQLMTSRKRGEYSINHLGVAEVDKLRKS